MTAWMVLADMMKCMEINPIVYFRTTISNENTLKNSFLTSGFKDLALERISVSFDFDSPVDFTDFILETSGPLLKMITNQTHERRVEIKKAVTEVAKSYADNITGKVRFGNEAILIVGKKNE